MTTATSATRFDVDLVCAWWRGALEAAREALDASAHSSPPVLSGPELAARASAVARERDRVATLLAADARARHVAIRRPLEA